MHLYIARLLAETPCQASPDKSTDCPPAPAAFTAAPLGRPGFVVYCRLTQRGSLSSAVSCSSGREFARRASFGHHLAMVPLPWATVGATTPQRGLSPPSQRPCWAYNTDGAPRVRRAAGASLRAALRGEGVQY